MRANVPVRDTVEVDAESGSKAITRIANHDELQGKLLRGNISALGPRRRQTANARLTWSQSPQTSRQAFFFVCCFLVLLLLQTPAFEAAAVPAPHPEEATGPGPLDKGTDLLTTTSASTARAAPVYKRIFGCKSWQADSECTYPRSLLLAPGGKIKFAATNRKLSTEALFEINAMGGADQTPLFKGFLAAPKYNWTNDDFPQPFLVQDSTGAVIGNGFKPGPASLTNRFSGFLRLPPAGGQATNLPGTSTYAAAGTLAVATDGKYYGFGSVGDYYSKSTARYFIRYDPSTLKTTVVKKMSITMATYTIIAASDGNIYAWTWDYDSKHYVFKMTTSGTMTTTLNKGQTEESYFVETMLESSDGNIYVSFRGFKLVFLWLTSLAISAFD